MVFTAAGLFGVVVTLLALGSRSYRRLTSSVVDDDVDLTLAAA